MKRMRRTWILNGEEVVVEFPPLRRLLDILREDLGLKGTKEGCGEGECGACTVVIDGRPLASCLVPAGQLADGTEILTVEGLEKTETGRVLQDCFAKTGAVQCGFCTPGMLLSSYALLTRHPQRSKLTDSEIRTALAGNICRCTGYVKIVEAVKIAGEIR